MRRTVALAILLLAAACSTAHASGGPTGSQLYGFINSNRTLTAAYPGPVYFVLGDVVVSPGATLTIEPGVMLQFIANHDTLQGGEYPGLGEISVHGALVADAGAGDSIRFVATNFDGGQWGQIRIESDGMGTFRKVAVRSAVKGIVIAGSGSVRDASISATSTGVEVDQSATIDNCVIADAGTGVVAQGGASTITRLTIANVVNGINAAGYGSVVRECLLRGRGNSSGSGLTIGAGSSTAAADSVNAQATEVSGFWAGVVANGGTIANVVSHDNSEGVQFATGTSSRVNYCTFARNSQAGMYTSSDAGGSVTNSIFAQNAMLFYLYQSYGWCSVVTNWDYCDTWNTGSASGACRQAGSHVTAFDPFFMDPANGDFHLAPSSVFYEYSNSGGQIGAYGPGPGRPVPVHTVTWGSVKARYR